MSDPKVIYLGPACQKEGDGREWCEDDVWPECECGCPSVKYMLESDALSQLAALREELARCSSGHTNLVDRNALLRQRPDLPADRIPAHEKLIDLQQRLSDAERRNAATAELLLRSKDVMAGIWDRSYEYEARHALEALDLVDDIEAALNKPEEAKPPRGSHVDCGDCPLITDGCLEKCMRTKP